MHIACILWCRFCRHYKATNSVQSHRFFVSCKHNSAYFIHSVTFKTSYRSYACMPYTPQTWYGCYTLMCTVHFGFHFGKSCKNTNCQRVSSSGLFNSSKKWDPEAIHMLQVFLPLLQPTLVHFLHALLNYAYNMMDVLSFDARWRYQGKTSPTFSVHVRFVT